MRVCLPGAYPGAEIGEVWGLCDGSGFLLAAFRRELCWGLFALLRCGVGGKVLCVGTIGSGVEGGREAPAESDAVEFVCSRERVIDGAEHPGGPNLNAVMQRACHPQAEGSGGGVVIYADGFVLSLSGESLAEGTEI